MAVRDRLQVMTWFKISLSQPQVAAGHVDRIQDTMAELLIDSGAPPGAALFGAPREDGGADLYVTASAATIAADLLKANGAVPCLPPVNEGNIGLLVGEKTDQRLLSS